MSLLKRAMSLEKLARFSPCDVLHISDALLKLKVPGSGFLGDLKLYNGPSPPIIAPASTVLFAPKSGAPENFPLGNIPSDKHYVDLTVPGTVVVVSQPAGQQNAVLGGIMALRMEKCGAVGVLVDGRVRDLEEYASLKLKVWGKATSTVGAGGESKPHAVQVPITVNGNSITPGDIIYASSEGVVAIPQDLLPQVLELLPKLVAADDKVKEAVAGGMSVKEAFEKFR